MFKLIYIFGSEDYEPCLLFVILFLWAIIHKKIKPSHLKVARS